MTAIKKLVLKFSFNSFDQRLWINRSSAENRPRNIAFKQTSIRRPVPRGDSRRTPDLERFGNSGKTVEKFTRRTAVTVRPRFGPGRRKKKRNETEKNRRSTRIVREYFLRSRPRKTCTAENIVSSGHRRRKSRGKSEKQKMFSKIFRPYGRHKDGKVLRRTLEFVRAFVAASRGFFSGLAIVQNRDRSPDVAGMSFLKLNRPRERFRADTGYGRKPLPRRRSSTRVSAVIGTRQSRHCEHGKQWNVRQSGRINHKSVCSGKVKSSQKKI